MSGLIKAPSQLLAEEIAPLRLRSQWSSAARIVESFRRSHPDVEDVLFAFFEAECALEFECCRITTCAYESDGSTPAVSTCVQEDPLATELLGKNIPNLIESFEDLAAQLVLEETPEGKQAIELRKLLFILRAKSEYLNGRLKETQAYIQAPNLSSFLNASPDDPRKLRIIAEGFAIEGCLMLDIDNDKDGKDQESFRQAVELLVKFTQLIPEELCYGSAVDLHLIFVGPVLSKAFKNYLHSIAMDPHGQWNLKTLQNVQLGMKSPPLLLLRMIVLKRLLETLMRQRFGVQKAEDSQDGPNMDEHCLLLIEVLAGLLSDEIILNDLTDPALLPYSSVMETMTTAVWESALILSFSLGITDFAVEIWNRLLTRLHLDRHPVPLYAELLRAESLDRSSYRFSCAVASFNRDAVQWLFESNVRAAVLLLNNPKDPKKAKLHSAMARKYSRTDREQYLANMLLAVCYSELARRQGKTPLSLRKMSENGDMSLDLDILESEEPISEEESHESSDQSRGTSFGSSDYSEDYLIQDDSYVGEDEVYAAEDEFTKSEKFLVLNNVDDQIDDQNAPELAERYFGEALDLVQDDHRLYYNLGIHRIHERNYEDALLCAEDGLLLNPDSADLWSLKAVVLSLLNREEEAMEVMDSVASDFWEDMTFMKIYIELTQELRGPREAVRILLQEMHQRFPDVAGLMTFSVEETGPNEMQLETSSEEDYVTDESGESIADEAEPQTHGVLSSWFTSIQNFFSPQKEDLEQALDEEQTAEATELETEAPVVPVASKVKEAVTQVVEKMAEVVPLSTVATDEPYPDEFLVRDDELGEADQSNEELTWILEKLTICCYQLAEDEPLDRMHSFLGDLAVFRSTKLFLEALQALRKEDRLRTSALLEDYCTLNPGNHFAWRYLLATALEGGETGRTDIVFRRFLREGLQDRTVFRLMSYCYASMNAADGAAEWFEKANDCPNLAFLVENLHWRLESS